jgi:tetratricopeptide (TPR) repeat protein
MSEVGLRPILGVLYGLPFGTPRPRAGIAIVLAAVVACGLAAHAAPPRPAATTQRAVADAEAALRRRDYDAARAGYQRAIAAAPDRPSEAFARRELADMHLLFDERREAATELERVVVLRPRDAASWHDLGIVRHVLGDIDGARTALERARTLAPADPRPRVALAALLWQRGDREAAAREYRALLDLELPPRLREKVEWAIRELARPPAS